MCCLFHVAAYCMVSRVACSLLSAFCCLFPVACSALCAPARSFLIHLRPLLLAMCLLSVACLLATCRLSLAVCCSLLGASRRSLLLFAPRLLIVVCSYLSCSILLAFLPAPCCLLIAGYLPLLVASCCLLPAACTPNSECDDGFISSSTDLTLRLMQVYLLSPSDSNIARVLTPFTKLALR